MKLNMLKSNIQCIPLFQILLNISLNYLYLKFYCLISDCLAINVLNGFQYIWFVFILCYKYFQTYLKSHSPLSKGSSFNGLGLFLYCSTVKSFINCLFSWVNPSSKDLTLRLTNHSGCLLLLFL